jgi:polysaccharide pyruvyl transferase WcaK-like protein/SAM-dependent methyltransferase
MLLGVAMADPRIPGVILVAASGFIYAPNSSNNLGDRAQLTRTVERLRTGFPDSRITAIANSLNDRGGFDDLEVSYSAIRYLTSPVELPGTRFRLPTNVARVLRVVLLLANARRAGREQPPVFLSRSGRVALREMKESSALFISGAGAFNDNYVTGVGGFWGVLVRCMSLLDKPVVASGQQIGPLTRFGRRAIAKWALRPIALLGVRDLRSVASANAVDIPGERVVLTGDDAWELAPARPTVAQAALKRCGVVGDFIAAQVRFGASVGWSEADSERLAVSLDHLSSELAMPIVFIPSATGRGADDRYAAACVRKQLGVPSWAIEDELDAPTTKAVLGSAALGVGTANHFCVFAASMGTPVVGLYSSPYMEQKVSGVAELWPDRVVALPKEAGLRPEELAAAARRLLEAHDDARHRSRGQPSVEMRPDEPVRFLARRLTEISDRQYSSRFLEGSSVEAYEEEFAAGRLMASVSELELRAVRSVLEQEHRTSFGRHLDFACGAGRATGFVEGFADTTVGVDVSAAMLDRARARFPRARFICGDVSTRPALLDEFGPFDLVTVWRFVAPAEPQLRLTTLAAIARSMADGGVLLVNNNANRTSLHTVALLVRSIVRAESLLTSRPYQQSLAHRDLCRLIEAVGLRVEETRAIGYLPQQLTRRLPPFLWMPLERALGRLNIAPHYSVNELVVARRSERVPHQHHAVSH